MLRSSRTYNLPVLSLRSFRPTPHFLVPKQIIIKLHYFNLGERHKLYRSTEIDSSGGLVLKREFALFLYRYRIAFSAPRPHKPSTHSKTKFPRQTTSSAPENTCLVRQLEVIVRLYLRQVPMPSGQGKANTCKAGCCVESPGLLLGSGVRKGPGPFAFFSRGVNWKKMTKSVCC